MNVLEEASEIVEGPRADAYGPASSNYGRLAKAISGVFGHKLKEDLTAMDAIMIMQLVKVVRQAYKPKRDNLVDIAGYARVGEKSEEK